MASLQINNSMAKRMKKMGFFGDYILAKRLQPTSSHLRATELLSRRFIDGAFRWDRTPQGYDFWLILYGEITD